ncbi:MAG TPA: nuclear transport factor 2 family protein [Candidatus Dormibacteraeota bacterium]|nr:nuclear transport factor 2 family protein [Candidatus Dormibacteraeota bacterium]
MATQSKLHSFYTDMIEQKYFANVRQKNLAATLACFCEDAVFTIQSAFVVHEGRDRGIKRMFERFFENYTTVMHMDFVHIVDPEKDRCAVQFNAVLVAPNGKKTTMSNCNVHHFENGKFKRVYVYMSCDNVLI